MADYTQKKWNEHFRTKKRLLWQPVNRGARSLPLSVRIFVSFRELHLSRKPLDRSDRLPCAMVCRSTESRSARAVARTTSSSENCEWRCSACGAGENEGETHQE